MGHPSVCSGSSQISPSAWNFAVVTGKVHVLVLTIGNYGCPLAPFKDKVLLQN